MNMSKEREFLKKLRYASLLENDLRKELEELLAQPEQDKAGTVIPNGVCVSNVYDAYEEGRKSVMSEQEPVAWCQMVEGKVQDLLTSFEMKDWLYDKSWIPLYTSPPTREPLSDKQIEYYLERLGSNFKWDDGFKAGVEWAEKAHGIGVDNE